MLADLRQISVKTTTPFLQKYSFILPLISLTSMAAVYISKNKLIVGISGSIALLFMGYSFFKIQGSKNIDKKIKTTMWWLLVVCASIIAVMYFKLSGLMDEINGN